MSTAKLTIGEKEFEFPVVVGTENERAIVISDLRAQTGHITLDPALGNSGACQSAIAFIDGEKGILRYRGYSIDQLAENVSFVEVCYMLIYGDLPTAAELAAFRGKLTY